MFRYTFETTSAKIFRNDDSKDLIHPKEFGSYRERACKDFLRLVTANEVSTECDIIIYDRQNTPLIEDSQKNTFFPVETVCGIVEVKSDLCEVDFRKALSGDCRLPCT